MFKLTSQDKKRLKWENVDNEFDYYLFIKQEQDRRIKRRIADVLWILLTVAVILALAYPL